jgi:hypothetical protein
VTRNHFKSISHGVVHYVEKNVIWVGFDKPFSYEEGVKNHLSTIRCLFVLACLNFQGSRQTIPLLILHNQSTVYFAPNAISESGELLLSSQELFILESMLVLVGHEDHVHPLSNILDSTSGIFFNFLLCLALSIQQYYLALNCFVNHFGDLLPPEIHGVQ